jgi:hypothetical protein
MPPILHPPVIQLHHGLKVLVEWSLHQTSHVLYAWRAECVDLLPRPPAVVRAWRGARAEVGVVAAVPDGSAEDGDKNFEVADGGFVERIVGLDHVGRSSSDDAAEGLAWEPGESWAVVVAPEELERRVVHDGDDVQITSGAGFALDLDERWSAHLHAAGADEAGVVPRAACPLTPPVSQAAVVVPHYGLKAPRGAVVPLDESRIAFNLTVPELASGDPSLLALLEIPMGNHAPDVPVENLKIAVVRRAGEGGMTNTLALL